MYYITELSLIGKKYKVYINDELFCLLYKGDLKKLNIEEGKTLSENEYNALLEMLYNRAKERALYIIEGAYKTKKQIRDKLADSSYPELIIDKVICFLQEYNFVNDYEYACMYIDYKSNQKSKKQIIQDLYQKGISKNDINNAIEDKQLNDEKSLKNIVQKKINSYNIEDKSELNKLYQFLLRKGYSYTDINNILKDYL